MKSVNDEDDAVQLLNEVTSILSVSRFNLTVIVSNSRSVLNSVPREKLSCELNSLIYLMKSYHMKVLWVLDGMSNLTRWDSE